MKLLFFEYPFFFLNTDCFCFGFKPFVPIFAVYFLLSCLYLRKFPTREAEVEAEARIESGIGKRLKQWWKKDLTKGEKGFMIAYLLLPFLYLFRDSSGGDGTFLTEFAENYLHYETLVFFLAAALRLIWIKSPTRLWKQAQMLDHVVRLMVVISVFATIITHQVDPRLARNVLCFFALGILAFTMEYRWRRRCPAAPDIENKDIFRPVETYEQLLPQQQLIADEIISMICGNCAESSASICVSGEWGVGKTSVVNGAIDELKRKDKEGGGKRQDEFIYINAMELDTLSSLFDYFFSRIRDILKKRGAYVGLGSEYQKFISSSIGKITDPSIAAFLESRLFPSSDDYRDRLDSLEKSIYTTMNHDMILVIVDDVERCEETKARSFIAFIKEIATMRGIVTVFITDFKYLSAPELPSGQGTIEMAEKESGFYYDKFFNYRISVPSINAEEFMQKKDAAAGRKKLRNQFGIRPTKDLFLDFKQRMDHIDQRYKKKQAQNEKNTQPQPQTNKIDQPGYLFGVTLGLPRTLSKFYHSLDQTLDLLAQRYLGENGLDDNAKTYFKNICLDEVLFFLTYVRVCAPNECSRVLEQGLEYFEQKDAEVSVQHRLVIALGEGLLYHYSPLLGIMNQSYHQSKAWQFVRLCLRGELPGSIESFSSKEEEWIAEIEKDNFQLMEELWPDMVSAVALTLAWNDPDRGKRCLNKLFSFAHEKLVNKEWELKEVFRIFDHQWRNEGTFSQKIPVMELFWEQFSDVLSKVSRADIQLLSHFETSYLWHRAESIVPALCLFVPPDKKWEQTYREVRYNLETILLGQESAGKRLNALLDRLSSLPIGLKLPPAEDAFARLDALAEQAEALLVERHLDGFPEMKDIVSQLRLATEEFRFFEKIKQKTIGGSISIPDRYIQNADFSEMDSIVEYLRQLADSNEPGGAERLRSDLQIFFDRLLSSKEPLSETQYQSLQGILTRYTDIYGRVPMLYRMALAEHWELGKTDGAPPEADENDNHEDTGLGPVKDSGTDTDSQGQQQPENLTSVQRQGT